MDRAEALERHGGLLELFGFTEDEVVDATAWSSNDTNTRTLAMELATSALADSLRFGFAKAVVDANENGDKRAVDSAYRSIVRAVAVCDHFGWSINDLVTDAIDALDPWDLPQDE